MAQSADTVTPVHTTVRRVLMSRFSAFGDVAMTVPVVYSACRCYPEVKFVMITRPAMVSMFVSPPDNLTVLGVDLKNQYAGLGGIRRLASMLAREYRPDVYVDLHNVLRTQLLGVFLRLRGVPVSRIYKARANRRALTRAHNKVMLPLTSQRARYREAFFKAGLPLVEKFDGLFGGLCKAPTTGFEHITGARKPGEKWLGIAPFAAHIGKVYPPEKMLGVLKIVLKRPDVRIFLFGGGNDERQVLDSWAEQLPRVTSLAGLKLGFANELALMNHLDAMVSMDSANMHLASLAGTPVISIWGATHPYCGFKPWHQAEADMVQLPVECRPCSVFGDKPCHRGDYVCLNAIKPELIASRIADKLGTAPQNNRPLSQ